MLATKTQTAYRIGTCTYMPYEYNWSQDVEKCTLYLVLSHCTRTNAVQATAVASKEFQNGLLYPSTPARTRCSVWVRVRVSTLCEDPNSFVSQNLNFNVNMVVIAIFLASALRPAHGNLEGRTRQVRLVDLPQASDAPCGRRCIPRVEEHEGVPDGP
jgi:hypothetical protein